MKDRITRLYANVLKDIHMFRWSALSYFLDRLLARASAGNARLYKYWIFAQPVESSEPRDSRSAGSAFEVRTVTESNARYEDYPRPAEVIQARFRQGGQCLAVYRDGTFVGYIWFNVGLYYEDEVRCCFVPQPHSEAAWDYDAFVVQRYRLGRAFKLLWSSALGSLYAQGVRVTYSRISPYNTVSLAAHARLGSRRVGTVYFLCLGRIECMVGTLPPYASISVAASHVPRLCVGSKRGRLSLKVSATRSD